MAANFGMKLTHRDLPLIMQLAQGAGGRLLGAADPQHLAAAVENAPPETGSLADSDGRPDSSVLLGTGMKSASFGRQSQFKRSVVERNGKLYEAHSYGPGTETKYFERKNPAVLRAAAAQAAQRQLGQPVAASGLSGRDEELLKLLLGNPSLHR